MVYFYVLVLIYLWSYGLGSMIYEIKIIFYMFKVCTDMY